METRSSDSIPPSAAQEQLRVARRTHDTSIRRALAPAWFILALSLFCGALTVAPAHKGPGGVLSIIAVVLMVAALIGMSARNRWRALRSAPKPRWNVTEVALIAVAVLVGGVIGPHLLASQANSALVSWALGVAVTVIVAICLFAAQASYRRRASRTWQP